MKHFFKKKELNSNKKYIEIPNNNINLDLKKKIEELERFGEQLGISLQNQYANKFKQQGKHNLKIWVCRDIDGDEINDLTSDRCLEKEYRSQIAINFDPQVDDDFYAATIELWYYYGGFKNSGIGTLYNLDQNDLRKEIEEEIIYLLNNNN
ncbi:hypothetical protein AAGG74_17635 [Bacillus mexicanus]|uniref:hypothetical protein n=1 Tax=Bacillus mexicanus TaxID=2834415 RepID=UPI003D24F201